MRARGSDGATHTLHFRSSGHEAIAVEIREASGSHTHSFDEKHILGLLDGGFKYVLCLSEPWERFPFC